MIYLHVLNEHVSRNEDLYIKRWFRKFDEFKIGLFTDQLDGHFEAASGVFAERTQEEEVCCSIAKKTRRPDFIEESIQEVFGQEIIEISDQKSSQSVRYHSKVSSVQLGNPYLAAEWFYSLVN